MVGSQFRSASIAVSRICAFLLWAFALACAFSAVDSHALTPSEAYKVLGKRQTTYDARQSKLPPAQAQALQELLTLYDKAVVQRAQITLFLRTDGAEGRPLSAYDGALAELATKLDFVPLEKDLLPIRELVTRALEEQQQYFHSIVRGRERDFYEFKASRAHPMVQSASKKLRRAYDMLMLTYSSESAHNKRAFGDHFAALDF
ncbi:MAG: hypothetical protein KDD69_06240 [Bdellovibrionales bacterium]|nr:hypothetical protein [Bdellovibrionales bacterium]